MKQFIFLMAIFLGGKWAAAQCLTNNGVTNCPNNGSVSSCPTWNGACNGWTVSHGTPNIATTTPIRGFTTPPALRRIDGRANESGYSEGIYTSYPFMLNNNYDLRILYNFYGNQPGSVNVYAAANVTSHGHEMRRIFRLRLRMVQNIYSYSGPSSAGTPRSMGPRRSRTLLPYNQSLDIPYCFYLWAGQHGLYRYFYLPFLSGGSRL